MNFNLKHNALHSSTKNNSQIVLSRKEIFDISYEISRGFSPVATVKRQAVDVPLFSQRELLEVSEHISLYYAPRISEKFKKLVVIPIDPQHLYIYWNMGDQQGSGLAQRLSNDELVLRVYSQAEKTQQTIKQKPVVEMTIHDAHARQRVRLPVVEKTGVYSASIGEFSEKKVFSALLESNNTPVSQAQTGQGDGFKKIDRAFVTKSASVKTFKSAYPGTNFSGQGHKR